MAPSLPVVGEFFIFSLDPVASFDVFNDDPILVEDCKELKARCKKYIGCCIEWAGFPFVGRRVPIQVAMVSRGLFDYPPDHINTEMTIPIAPATKHGLKRRPLHCDPALPWSEDCYFSTLDLNFFKVKYLEPDFRPRGKFALMPRQQGMAIITQREYDLEWQHARWDAVDSGGLATDVPPIGPSPDDGEHGFNKWWKKMMLQEDEVTVADQTKTPGVDSVSAASSLPMSTLNCLNFTTACG
ncbi:hypothetical protein C8R45DRAFT_961428 [Mycena sanguinolenta]|nr:hypothetical protein C8R45DRAFT_961428 [Mycena sanguinolenta]